nr:MAG TPA: hypothetical protein [Caudoviricetes sp.]
MYVDSGMTVCRCVEALRRFSFGVAWSISLGSALPRAG